MARDGFEWSVKPTPTHRQTVRYLKELERRMRVVRKMIAREAAKYVLESVKEKLPTSDDYVVLRDSLEVRDVFGLKSEKIAASSIIPKKNRRKREGDFSKLPMARIVLVVQAPNKRIQPPPKGIDVLREYNPWTIDTIPFVPKKSIAKTVYRKVTEEEVKELRLLRKRQMPEIKSLLDEQGIRLDLKPREEEGGIVGSAGADLANMSLRAEFGLGGTEAHPHWRPALKDAQTKFIREFFRRRDVKEILYDSDYKGWKTLPKRIYLVDVGDVQEYQRFQEKLGVTVK